ncbi:MAG: DUF951 domain-containing protein [Syntrophomonadaceae bacterium]|nr:DUF951 domain-containing protein [Syntrophomonadaceae bacterium]
MIPKFNLGDVVRLRKSHPCGSYEWEITRTGMDIRIKCLGCGRQVMLPRVKFEKSVKTIVRHQENSP